MAPVDVDDDEYDEFGLLHENAAEIGLPFDGPPPLERRYVTVGPDQQISAIVWGDAPPELVFIHGGGQNAHTFDTVILALGRPAVAIDMPGHGHSSTRPDRNYGPTANAEAIARALPELAPNPAAVVGMSLGGASLIRLTARHPGLVPKVVLVDVTPASSEANLEMSAFDRGSVGLVGGPQEYESFEAMADATVALSPYRAPAGVRRGVRHNSRRTPEGRWRWRYDLGGPRPEGSPDWSEDFETLWDDLGSITVPLMLVRGALSKFVRDEDADRVARTLPSARIDVVEGSGHAVQSDQPMALVALLNEFVPAR